MDKRRALLVVNPAARRPPRRDLLQAGITWLEEHGWSVKTRHTSRPHELEELAAKAAGDSFDSVVVCGGDGTLNEALNGVAGTQTALGLVPCGTANVWAREAGLPHDPLEALRLLEEGRRPRLDTGSAGGRAFLLMASIGLDSLVAGRVTGEMKHRLSFLPYLAYAAAELPRYQGLDAEVTIDGQRFDTGVVGILAGNTRSYGGLLQITREARADDGLLDVCIYRGTGQVRFLSALAMTALGRHIGAHGVVYRRARTIEVQTRSPWPVQADGEDVGQTPLTIECVPRSVTVIVPAGGRSPLWNPGPTLCSIAR